MKANQSVVLAAITLVMSGAVSYPEACTRCEQIADELAVNESKELRNELAVMKECVELYDARQQALKDIKA